MGETFIALGETILVLGETICAKLVMGETRYNHPYQLVIYSKITLVISDLNLKSN